MSEAILVLNAGSSSLKFSVFGVTGDELSLIARGQTEGLGASPQFKARDAAGQVLAETRLELPAGQSGHVEAFVHLAQWLRARYAGQLTPVAVGHRIVHGGLNFIRPTLIDAEVVTGLEKLVPFAPLHQPFNIAGINAVSAVRPDLPQVACFDTAFHHGREPVTERFGLPDDMFRRGGRRWGFHGLSYESIAGQLRRLAPQVARGRVIAAHLGSGASLCAMNDGRSIDTTMAFSTLDGLPMGTRCGNLDPGVILFLLRQGWSVEQLEDLLYKKSGLLGVSNLSNDVRDLLASYSPSAAEAIAFFVYRIIREIGSLTAALGGLDAVVFTAGIGENSPVIRERVCQGLAWLGVTLDANANQSLRAGTGRCISPPGRTPSVWVIPTDEELVIATHTLAVIRSRGLTPRSHN
jgi:acetate kinase